MTTNTTPSGADAHDLLLTFQSWIGPRRPERGNPDEQRLWDRIDAAIAALSAAQDAPAQAAQAVPQGWVMVPKEPTPGMLQIGRHAAPYRAVDVYRAMLAAAPAAPQPAAQQGWDIDAAVEKAWGRFQAAMDKDEPLPPPSVHAAAHYGTWLGREAHRHDEPRAGAFRNAARMLAVLEAETRRLHAELVAAQAQEAAPRDSLHDCAVGDSNYAAGMLLGWNLCVDGRDEEFRRIREDRLRAAVSASKEAQEAAPAAQGEPSAWHRIEEDAEVDVPLDTDLLLAWWDQWSEAWKIEANYAGSESGGWRHGRATHWMPLPAPPSAAQQKGGAK